MNVDLAEFRRAVSSILEVLSDLVDGGIVSAVQVRHDFSPSVASECFGCMEEANRLGGPWMLDPLNEVQNVTLEKFGLAEDHMRAYVTLLKEGEYPVAYAHQTVARAAFEALAWAHHLGPWELFRERFRRTLNHQLQAAYDIVNLEKQIGTSVGGGIKADKYLGAEKPGFDLTNEGTYLRKGPPNTITMLSDLLGSEDARVIYTVLSWSAHGKLMGARAPMRIVEEPSDLSGQALLGAGPTSLDVFLAGIHLATAYLAEAKRMAEYSGWLDKDWNSLVASVEQRVDAIKGTLMRLAATGLL